MITFLPLWESLLVRHVQHLPAQADILRFMNDHAFVTFKWGTNFPSPDCP
jgi:hypothetical protein